MKMYLDMEGGPHNNVVVDAMTTACQALVNNLMPIPSNQFHSQ
jgi:hypothetical protein